MDRLKRALTRARRREGKVAIMFMDLDNFKVVNDSLGHKTGDRLLVTASKRIRTFLRPEDTVARLGGDEFVFLLEDTDLDGASRVAERILEELRAPFYLGGRGFFVTVSIGIAVGGGNGKHAADLLRDGSTPSEVCCPPTNSCRSPKRQASSYPSARQCSRKPVVGRSGGTR
jgi:two-component system CheB/CheR fusion protein